MNHRRAVQLQPPAVFRKPVFHPVIWTVTVFKAWVIKVVVDMAVDIHNPVDTAVVTVRRDNPVDTAAGWAVMDISHSHTVVVQAAKAVDIHPPVEKAAVLHSPVMT
jgi:hypothetical protein